MRSTVDTATILDLNRRFHDEVEAKTYDTRMGTAHDEASCTRMINELESVLGSPLPRGGRVLDLACGTGNVAIKLAKTGWYDGVVGVDISSRSLGMARYNARKAGTMIATMPSDLQTLPFDDNSMDMIVGCAFLHHLPRPDLLMHEIVRVLKPGAPFILIGEPTAFGALAINTLKSPLVLLNRVLKRICRTAQKPQNAHKWDHANIDVHDFTRAESALFLRGFTNKRTLTQGFLEPILDQAILTPIRHVTGDNKIVGIVLREIGIVMRFFDQILFNHILPKFMRVSLKLSGRKPT